MREHRSKSGRLIYFASRLELEQLPGYRGNDRRARACCPIHDGDNPTALSIDWERGWASCWSCGDAFAIRIDEENGARDRGNMFQSPIFAPRRANRPPKVETIAELSSDTQAALQAAIVAAAARLPGSPGAEYLERRGIPLEVAQQLRLGWSVAGKLSRRVVFPLSDPDGQVTSAIGRTIDDRVKPKYDTLPRDGGYQKTLFNGAAVTQARQSGHPLVIVEGPMDVAACVVAGVPLAVAICGKSYAHPEHFAGIETAILALDADEAGQKGRQALWLELTARGVEVLVLPVAALGAAKDLCEYWQLYRSLPMQILSIVMGPKLRGLGRSTPLPAVEVMPKNQGFLDFPHDETPLPTNPVHLEPTSSASPRFWGGESDSLAGLSPSLRAEAEELATELANNPQELQEFTDDLFWREFELSPEDRRAAHYAIGLARAEIAGSHRDQGRGHGEHRG